MILGASGSGKSASMRNFSEDEVRVFNVASKPFPFKAKLPKLNEASYRSIMATLSKPDRKIYVIDDSQYLLAFAAFDRAKETGYQKFTDFALDFRNLIDFVIRKTPPDVVVYFLHHTEQTEDGRIKAKTIGKMLDSQLTVEGLFSIVLLCKTDGTRHYFETQSDGYTTAKSPIGMFPAEIDNDLKMVDSCIRDYWSIGKNE